MSRASQVASGATLDIGFPSAKIRNYERMALSVGLVPIGISTSVHDAVTLLGVYDVVNFVKYPVAVSPASFVGPLLKSAATNRETLGSGPGK